jgi:threonine dehydrogenase-like Zn-dependent dehydrogenase
MSMRAITVLPGREGSAELSDVPEPGPEQGALLVDAVALGICGTDAEIIAGAYGEAPPGHDRLVLGHESLGRVREAPEGSGFAPGDLVVGIVRRPDPVPCRSCGLGEWDFCQNGRYTERGIKALDGYGSERWRLEPEFAVKLDPGLGLRGVLMEPTSVVAKAWEQIDRIVARATPRPERVLVTGAGPIGLLAALLSVQRGYETTVLDRVDSGPKPGLVRDLGATYHQGGTTDLGPPDVILECTGAPALVLDAMTATRPNGITCLTGVSTGGRTLPVDPGELNRQIVLENDVVFGSVNANRRHYEAAAEALDRADAGWLDRVVSRRVPLADWPQALERTPEDVKVVVDFGAQA